VKTDLTVVAHADTPGARVDRLLWAAASRRGRRTFDVVVVDRCPGPDAGLANQLALYRGAVRWWLVRPGGGGTALGGLVAGDTVLSLPASAVPVGDAVWRLSDATTGVCRTPGPFLAYSMDDMGTNLTADLVRTSPVYTGAAAWVVARREWHSQVDRLRTVSQVDAEFVLFPPQREHFVPRPEHPVEVLAANA
jgi:hypothetical protein